MSGVVGLFNLDQAPLDAALLTKMTAAMAVRGPDAQHSWADRHVGLGHTLLRTTMESAHEAQPCSLDGEVWITADARIDGRAGILPHLRRRGREVARNAPDVELILHAYLAWGDACLDHLIGDFAFVLWDGREGRLLAARDRLGVAQLFYAQAEGALVLGNTLHSLMVHPGVADTLDEQMLADVALFLMPLDDAATAYAAVRRVSPGHKLTCDGRALRVERYWTLGRPARAIRYRRPDEYAEHFQILFDDALGDRLRTESVGSQLSGGMDSTSVTVTANHLLQASGRPFDLRAYTIECKSLIPDEEGRLATLVARHSGFPIEVLDGEAYLTAEPAADRAWAPPEPGAGTLWAMEDMCQRTAAVARVLLTGFGGDPLLASPELSWHRAWAAVRHGYWKWLLRGLAVEGRRRRDGRQPGPLPAWVNERWAERMNLEGRTLLFRQRARPDPVGLADGPLWRTLFAYSDAGYHGLPIDIRFPFFDLRLLEFVLAIPPAPWLERKGLLRLAMGDRLPEVVRTRPKTVMPGNVTLEKQRRTGVPDWQIELLAAPEMAPYIDEYWLGGVRNQPTEAQAETWARDRPPVELGYWLRHRPRWDQAAGGEGRNLTLRRAGSSSFMTGGRNAAVSP